ncbi:hypothetical protein [Massilia sp. LjRoot122]|uniref:hypothetical protein n=1 Tax=Massilia sp. LjRoot122 TaxID=3342257 RepID=UPI003ECFA270
MPALDRLHSAADDLRRTSWLQLAGYAYLVFFVLMLARLAAPADIGPALRRLAWLLPLFLLAAKDLAHLPDALQRLRDATGWRSRVTALLPPELLGMFRLERLMWTGFGQWLRRRAPAPVPQGLTLSYLQRGAYGTAVGIVMVALFLELPANVVVINMMVKDADARLAIHVAGAILALYSFVWVLADRWYLKGGAHVLVDGVLHLSVGVRTEGSIPLAAIERVDALAEAPERWRRRHGIHRADTLLVTPVDKPNCVLRMKPDAGLTLLHWQVRRSVPRYLLLYLDRPELLASRITRSAD